MMYVIAVFLPPIAALIKGGIFSFMINLLLLMLMWLPAIIHAVYLVSKDNQKKQNQELARMIRKGEKT